MLTTFNRIKQFAILQCVDTATGTHRLKTTVTDDQYQKLKSGMCTLEKLVDVMGEIPVFHVGGTATVMLSQEFCDMVYDRISSISGIILEKVPSTFYQRAPDTLVPKLLTCRHDVVALYREIQPFKQANKHHQLKQVQVNPNKLAKKRNSKAAARKHLQLIRDYYHSSHIVCIDVEAFEFKQSKLLEIGVAIKDPNGNFSVEHYIITDNEKYKNKKYVPNHREYFLYGQSRRVTLVEAIEQVRSALTNADCLVGHSVKGDIDFIKNHVDDIIVPPKIADTAYLGKCVLDQDKRTPSLGDLMNHYNIQCDRLHNAGNDAMVTLMVLDNMITR